MYVCIEEKLVEFFFIVYILFQFSSSLCVPITRTPQQHIEIILRKQATSLNMRIEPASNYVLKVCGREEYLFGDYPIIQFQYIQEMLSRDLVPQVMTISIDKLQFLCESVIFL
jgi:phosphatidylinositol-4,5-bisphosphate 3-kinase catalytic subunit alpha/beta/delta